MFERFTDRARRALVLAQQEARLLNHNFIGTEHVLLGLIAEGEGVAANALRALGISLDAARERVEETIGMLGTPPSGAPPFTPRAKKVLELALREALQLGHSYIGTEHMLLGLVREGEGVAATILVSLGADLGSVRQATLNWMSGREVAPGWVNDLHSGSRPPVSSQTWAPPVWDRPSEGTVPAVLAIDTVVLHNDLIAVALESLEVYPNGFTVRLVLRVNPHRVRDLVDALGAGGPNRRPYVGVRFADGRNAMPISDPSFMAALPKDDQGIPTEPIVSTGGGGGGFDGWRAWAWVFPLPPDGPLEIMVSLEAAGLSESCVTVDGSAVQAAAERARILWT